MSTLVLVPLAVLAFFLALASDYLETKYVQAVQAGQAGDKSAAVRAARCSVAMWVVGVIGLIACVEVSWWLILPEGLGLYVGTMRAMKS